MNYIISQRVLISITYFLVFFFPFLFCNGQMELNNKQNNTLYISSYSIDYIWTRKVTEGISKQYSNWEDNNLLSEFMDSRKPSPHFNFLEYLNNKYGNTSINLIIVADNAALDFVVKHRNDSLFENKPIVFCGISNPEDYDLQELNLVGVREQTVLSLTFNAIKDLYPDMEKVIVIADNTITGEVYKKQAIQQIQNEYRISLEIIDTITNDNTLAVIDEINQKKNAALFYFGVTKYADGNNADDIKVAQLLADNCNIPIFSSYIADIENITGGRFAYSEEHGKTTALIAKRLLDGEQIEQRIFNTQSGFIFNYSKLIEFGIDPKRAPAGTVFISKPITVFSRYKMIIIWFSLLIIIMVFAIIVLVRYIAIEKKNRSLVEKARDKALESDRLKGAFLANVSHELRTPLNAISGFSELAMIEDPHDELKQYLQIIHTNTHLLSQLVNDILDLSLIDADEIKLVNKAFDLERMFDQLYMTTLPLLASNDKMNLELHKKTNPKQGQLTGDELRINQIMHNFLVNAVKFTEEGSITFGYDNLQAFPDIAIAYPEYKSALLLYVSDTGVGINTLQQKVIFERFSRDDSHYRSQHGGFGLGLNIARSLASLMNGKIYLKSKKGLGSTFGLILPLD